MLTSDACKQVLIVASGVARKNNMVGHKSGHDVALTDKLVMKFALCIFVEDVCMYVCMCVLAVRAVCAP